MTLETKMALATMASVGAIGGVLGIGYALPKPNNLKEALINENLTPLSKSDTTHADIWTNLAKKYAESGSTPKITDFDLELEGQNLKAGELVKLQQKCEDLFIKKPKDNNYTSSLDFAKAWCVKESKKLPS
ncbi:hypothetical protein A6V39_00445 [Candidatus Mycoplasma haematobovis]|uniref:Uncharacterized protein n=1 Tax=Candidatus Mycoplasma haematobovis TaxID=432608 RepID=A0A1A9QFM8_9MOLU|nr:hypothetical protein [Candidatus Mycoplasma haematobovis]OAL10519.1 hypothetical protein A6V39_00445 [Candidatus Mycoplasma haematobovis]